MHGKSVLDVASGSGLIAIAAMKAGAASALAVDIDAFAMQAGILNAALNDVRIASSDADPLGLPSDADLVLVGDLFYDRDLAPRVLAWLETLHAQGKAILIGDPGRTYLPKDRLEKIATYDVPVTRAIEDSEVKHASVWRLR